MTTSHMSRHSRENRTTVSHVKSGHHSDSFDGKKLQLIITNVMNVDIPGQGQDLG